MYVLFYVGFGLDRFLGLKRSLVFVWRLRLRGFDFTYHLMIHPGVWCVTWNMIYSGCYFYFSFLSHFCLFAFFDVFPRVEKIRVLTRFLINYFLFSTPLHLPIFISSSAFLFLIERVSCINIHVQNNFSFFSLSLSLSFFKAILPVPANSWIYLDSVLLLFFPLYSRYILVRCSS